MTVSEVNSSEFDKEVLQSAVPVVVDIWAEWCGPCRAYSPIIDAVSDDLTGKVKFVKVDADKNEPIANKYNVMSIPTTLLIVKGQLKAMNVGAMQKESLRKWIDKNL